MHDKPTKKQLSYIESLGGNSKKIKTRQRASEYIDKLKGSENNTKKPISVSFTQINLLVAFT
jgi:hypothetical protein